MKRVRYTTFTLTCALLSWGTFAQKNGSLTIKKSDLVNIALLTQTWEYKGADSLRYWCNYKDGIYSKNTFITQLNQRGDTTRTNIIFQQPYELKRGSSGQYSIIYKKLESAESGKLVLTKNKQLKFYRLNMRGMNGFVEEIKMLNGDKLVLLSGLSEDIQEFAWYKSKEQQ